MTTSPRDSDGADGADRDGADRDRAEAPFDGETFDIVTPTDRELRDTAIAERRRRYFLIMVPCIALVIFGFFVPAPTPLRLVALGAAAVMPPLAAIVANPPRRR